MSELAVQCVKSRNGVSLNRNGAPYGVHKWFEIQQLFMKKKENHCFMSSY